MHPYADAALFLLTMGAAVWAMVTGSTAAMAAFSAGMLAVATGLIRHALLTGQTPPPYRFNRDKDPAWFWAVIATFVIAWFVALGLCIGLTALSFGVDLLGALAA